MRLLGSQRIKSCRRIGKSEGLVDDWADPGAAGQAEYGAQYRADAFRVAFPKIARVHACKFTGFEQRQVGRKFRNAIA